MAKSTILKHRMVEQEDVKLMVGTGLDAYRLSISWSRLIPNGRGPINPKGLQFYNNLINELISSGIQPHVTLHNYDLPQALEDEYGDGLVLKSCIRDFINYAKVCFREFGDRVLYWNTMNEPNVFTIGGYDQPHLHDIRPHFSRNITVVGIILPTNDTDEDWAATQRAHDFFIDALKQLYLIDVIDENGAITSIGQKMAELSLEPSLSRTLMEANDYDGSNIKGYFAWSFMDVFELFEFWFKCLKCFLQSFIKIMFAYILKTYLLAWFYRVMVLCESFMSNDLLSRFTIEGLNIHIN
ncbi:hypothetical protein Ahy_A04g020225 isoform A [Arachis hypogaea]|uniref:Helicase associated domain-containing protein n=2 Tax=Arachis hypogaea TaxID=3818 RepID=A0A445DHG7_ARAHY|nr:hypothetical protein Ahy_A04g020225 isoform A [Arachis hypogaea]